MMNGRFAVWGMKGPDTVIDGLGVMNFPAHSDQHAFIIQYQHLATARLYSALP